MPRHPDASDFASQTWTGIGEALSVGESGILVALLPVGSTEPHGPHLPLSTDVIISCEAARRSAALLAAAGVRALILPALAYTVTEFSKDFPGAVGISRATCEATVAEICASLLRQGFAAVCLVNSHLEPDHLAALREGARRAADAAGKPVFFPDKTQRRWAALLTEEFRSGACHAGQYETSLVMAERPDLVSDEKRRALPPNAISIGRKIKEGARSFREAGGEQAYFGDPAAATAMEGESTFDALATMVATAVLEGLGLAPSPADTR